MERTASVNLFQAAADNAEPLYQRYLAERAAAAPEEAEGWDRFVAQVESEGRLAVNMQRWVLAHFLMLDGGYRNVYGVAADLEGRTGFPSEQFLCARLGAYFERRIAFDGRLDGSERLLYGALNLGGLGAARFGKFCVVFRSSFAAGLAELAYLWADSLQTYLLPDGSVDEERLCRDACPHSHRHYLAGLKHGAEACRLGETKWPPLVCSEHRLIEAIFAGDPGPGDLEAVRMDRAEYKRYTVSLPDALLGRLSVVETEQILSLYTLVLGLEERAIPLETVAA
jgi:hypothetical protein